MAEGISRETRGLRVRATFLVGFLVVLFLLLLGRFFDLMILRHEELSRQAEDQARRARVVCPPRASLLDRHGHPLALTRKVPSVAVDPMKVGPEEREELAARIARALDRDLDFVRDQLSRRKRFRWIRRQITDPAQVAAVEVLRRHPAVIVREECARCYPAGRVAAPYLGFTDADGRGIAGLERTWDDALRGTPGRRVVELDGKTRAVALPPEGGGAAAEAGRDVVLALDLAIQTFVEEALDRAVAEWRPKSAVAVVLDPRTADVLAVAGRPDFDPDRRAEAPAGAFRIGAVADGFEIGSAMKPLIAAAALDRGVVSIHDSFDCTANGAYRIGPRTLHDHKPMGVLSLPEVLIRSSNIGMARVAAKLGVERTYRFVRGLGFGKRTGSGLPGEIPGTVFPRDEWNEVWVLPSVAMGRDLLVTPLQFATAFAALLDGGVLHRPRLALRVGDREIDPEPVRQIVVPAVARRLIVPTLVRVVEEGTGTEARVPGYRVGGKTGTSRLKARGEVAGYVSSFVGFAPAEDPRFLVLVVMNRPRRDRGVPYGGSCAAPCVGEILGRALRYAEIEPRAPASPAPRSRAVRPPVPTPAGAAPPRPRSRSEIDRIQYQRRMRR